MLGDKGIYNLLQRYFCESTMLHINEIYQSDFQENGLKTTTFSKCKVVSYTRTHSTGDKENILNSDISEVTAYFPQTLEGRVFSIKLNFVYISVFVYTHKHTFLYIHTNIHLCVHTHSFAYFKTIFRAVLTNT